MTIAISLCTYLSTIDVSVIALEKTTMVNTLFGLYLNTL